MNRQSIKVFFDVGISSSKAIAIINGQARYDLVAPFVLPLIQNSYLNALQEPTNQSLECAIIAYSDNGVESRYLVGESANPHGVILVGQKKTVDLMPKVVAYLGYLIHDVMGVGEGQNIEIDLTFLLPFDEYGDRHLMAPIKSLKSFHYNGALIDGIEIKSLACKIEGFGLYTAMGSIPNSALLMFGHADFTILSFVGDRLDKHNSFTFQSKGYHDFLTNVSDGFSIPDELKAAEKISIGKAKALKELIPGKGKDEDFEILQAACANGKEQYWLERSRTLSALDLSDKKVLIPAGGGYSTFSAEVKSFFNSRWSIAIVSTDALRDEFCKIFGVTDLILANRFLDIYSVFKTSRHFGPQFQSILDEAQEEDWPPAGYLESMEVLLK